MWRQPFPRQALDQIGEWNYPDDGAVQTWSCRLTGPGLTFNSISMTFPEGFDMFVGSF
jgi:hypothetical protein